MNVEGFNNYNLDNLTISDKWILSKLNRLIKKVRYHMDKYEFNVVGSELYSFIWDDFCDWYIELSKFNQNDTTKSVLIKVLTDILKMLHPFMPYVTEEIYGMLPLKDSESIMISEYPKCDELFITEEERNLDEIIEFVVKVRTYKLENSIPKDSKYYFIGENKELITKILKLDSNNEENEKTDNYVILNNYEIYFKFDNSLNLEKEKESLLKEKEKLEKSINRRTNLLNNENYVSKAPANLVENEKITLEKETNELEIIVKKLKELS